MESSSTVVRRDACPKCRETGDDHKGDNLAVYDDGHVHCFACGYHKNGDGDGPSPPTAVQEPKSWKPLKGRLVALPKRGITKDTCQRFDYRVAKVGGEFYEVANYVKNGELVGQKVRGANKRFMCKGDMRNAPMFGQHLWRSGGSRIVITEGEIDALSMYQMLNGNGTSKWTWPVVSLPAGASSAAAAVRANLDFLNSYDKVVLCFDNDEPGKAAALEAAQILAPGKAHICHLSMKDANEHLVNGDPKTAVTAVWEAQAYRPDGILHIRDVDMSTADIGDVWDYPWESMTRTLYGRRSGELVVHSSGSGMGKSTVMREMIWFDLQQEENVGVMMLEESCRDTKHDLMSLILNKPVRRIMAARKLNDRRVAKGRAPLDFGIEDSLTQEEYDYALNRLSEMGCFLYDHFGSQDVETLMARMEYLVTSMGCQKIYLDHLSIVISGMETGNERKDIDVLMTKLRSFVERTDCHVDAVCHLSKPNSKPFEEGGQISLRDFRGSAALYQLADSCIGYERNQQHPDHNAANTIAVRSLKDRFSGVTGVVAALRFHRDTGRLTEVEWTFDEKGEVIFAPGTDAQVSYNDMFPDAVEDPMEVGDDVLVA